jgi:hypothetical protein
MHGATFLSATVVGGTDGLWESVICYPLHIIFGLQVMANVTLRIRARCPSQTLVKVTFTPSGHEHYQIEKPSDKTHWEFAGRTFRTLAECTQVVHRSNTPFWRKEDVLGLWETADDDPPRLLSSLRSKFSPKFTRLRPQINMSHTSDDETETETKMPPPVPRIATKKNAGRGRKRTDTTGPVRAPRVPRKPRSVNVEEKEESEPEIREKDTAPQEYPNLYALPSKEWTEGALHLYFNRPERGSGLSAADPVLLGFGPKAKRYGVGACFKFKGDFVHPKTQQVIRQWVRYTDLVPNPQYMQKLTEIHFNISTARHAFLDTNDYNEWSDGVDEFVTDDGVKIPDLSLTATKSATVRKPTPNKHTKYPEFSIRKFRNEDDAQDSEPEEMGCQADYRKEMA